MSRPALDADVIVVGRINNVGIAWSQNTMRFTSPDDPSVQRRVTLMANAEVEVRPHPLGNTIRTNSRTPVGAAAAIMAANPRADILEAPEDWWALIPDDDGPGYAFFEEEQSLAEAEALLSQEQENTHV